MLVVLRYKRGRPEMDTNGFYGDTFSSGWGDFYPARKRAMISQREEDFAVERGAASEVRNYDFMTH